KPQIVAVTKMDLPDVQELWETIQEELEKVGVTNVIPLSSVAHRNTDLLVGRIFREYDRLPDLVLPVSDATAVYELEDDPFHFDIAVAGGAGYVVSGAHIERAAAMTYWDNEEAVYRFQKILETTGITKALEEAGVQVGDTVRIGELELEWSD
ncbi:MAG: Obg family GTPase CgtA, partial [Chloroflexota bacterium]